MQEQEHKAWKGKNKTAVFKVLKREMVLNQFRVDFDNIKMSTTNPKGISFKMKQRDISK